MVREGPKWECETRLLADKSSRWPLALSELAEGENVQREVDLVLGSKNRSDSAILALLERKTRQYFMIRVPGRNPDAVMAAILNLKERYKEHWNDIFKTMTTDNGSEFSKLSALEQLSKTLVYFAHPYAPHEKGSVERHNRLIRRFIRKGVPINYYSDERILQVQHWCNSLPRKMLGYRTPDELFEEELTRIYGGAAWLTQIG